MKILSPSKGALIGAIVIYRVASSGRRRVTSYVDNFSEVDLGVLDALQFSIPVLLKISLEYFPCDNIIPLFIFDTSIPRK
jgi:hypothetical protein